MHVSSYINAVERASWYGVATDSRIDKIIGLFCRIMSLLQGSFTKETYKIIDPTNQSHHIFGSSCAREHVCVKLCIYVYMYIYI